MADNNRKWYQLDNAAKIIPSTVQGANTRVFRISCELTENVDPEILQNALDDTIDEFPHFNCVLRKGAFWYYLEYRDNLHCVVHKENLPPCSQLYFPGRKTLLYRVFYYKRRISLEMFHVLADGTGAFVFLKNIITRYLNQKYDLHMDYETVDSSSRYEKNDDAFKHFYEKSNGLNQLKSLTRRRAYQIKGERDQNQQPHLIEGCVSSKQILEVAHKYNTSVGVLSTAVYVASIIDEMTVGDFKKPIVVSVPVNLRQFFPSETTRNFYGTITVVYDPKDYNGNLDSIIEFVKDSFAKQLSPESIQKTMNSYAALEHNLAVKVVPLFIKDIAIQWINTASKKGVTSTISNLGNIKMPEKAAPYIKRFSCFMPAPSQQICVSSFGDSCVFGEVSAYTTHEIMLHFFRRLVNMGIEVEITSSDHNMEEDKINLFKHKLEEKFSAANIGKKEE